MEKVLDCLFEDKEISYIVPPYQRNFTWENINCEAYIDNIYKAIRKKNPYLFGYVVFKPDDENHKVRKIVDGQQRIICFMLMLKALTKSPALSAKDKEWIENVIYCDTVNKIPRLIARNADREMFNHIMNDTAYTVENKNYKMNKAFTTFCELLNKDTEQLESFCKGIRNMGFTKEILNSDDDEMEIFADLNSTGEPIKDFDLIRRYIMDLPRDMGTDEDIDNIIAIFDEIDSLFPPTGKGEYHRDNFAKIFVELNGGNVTSSRHGIYKAFKNLYSFFTLSERMETLYKFKKMAIIYSDLAIRKTYNKKETGIDSSLYSNVFDSSSYPLLVRLVYANEYEHFPAENVKKMVEYLQSYLVRCKLNNDKSKGGSWVKFVNTAFDNCFISCAIYGNNICDEFVNMMRSHLTAHPCPTNSEITRSVLENFNFYKKNDTKFINYLLRKIEETKQHNMFTICTDVEVEHACPQNITDEDLEKLGLSREIHEKWVNHIGNLTLLSPEKNKDKGNRLTSYYFKDNPYKLNSTYLADHIETWNPEVDCIKRAEDLLATIFEIWPSPTASI